MAQGPLQYLAQLHGLAFPNENSQISYLADSIEGQLSVLRMSLLQPHSCLHAENSKEGCGVSCSFLIALMKLD